MKFLYLSFSFVILFSGCSQQPAQQQKAEDAVKKYIKTNANSASSYEPVLFSRLDTIYRLDTLSYEALDSRRKEVVARYNEANASGNMDDSKLLKDQLLVIDKQIEGSKFPVGLRIFHVFNGKNSEDAQVVNRGSFYLDSNFVVQEFTMSEDSVLMLGER